MTLVVVEVSDEAAVERLRQQPGVRVVSVTTTPAVAAGRLSIAGLVGSLSDGTAERMRVETNRLRDEWEREF